MKKENNPRPRRRVKKKKTSGLVIVMCCVVIVLLLAIIGMMLMVALSPKKQPAKATTPGTTLSDVMETTETTVDPTATTGETTLPPETEPVILDHMQELLDQNPDTIGYVRIDGTKLDYPVMYTPDDEEKYLRTDFEGNFSVAGLPFIDKDCSVDPESDNLIIYGHNMLNGTAFRTLMSYDQKTFWEQHPTFYYSSLYEERTYEIVAAFYDRVYLKTDDCFKFYQFIDAETEEDFNEAITYYKENSLYDTGVDAKFGDNLITLVTCAYHVDNGRFVVIGREITE